VQNNLKKKRLLPALLTLKCIKIVKDGPSLHTVYIQLSFENLLVYLTQLSFFLYPYKYFIINVIRLSQWFITIYLWLYCTCYTPMTLRVIIPDQISNSDPHCLFRLSFENLLVYLTQLSFFLYPYKYFIINIFF
jgi:hypothetical protein